MEEGDCTICLDPLVQDLRVLPCGHVFHGTCIAQALHVKKLCPQCRSKCCLKDVIKLFFRVSAAVSETSSSVGPTPTATSESHGKCETKITLLRKQIAHLQEDKIDADAALQRWEDYSAQMKAAFRQLEAQVMGLKRDKERLTIDLATSKRSLVEMDKAMSKKAVDVATMTFLESNDVDVLESELQHPVQIITALKKANKFRLEQYQKVVMKLKEKENKKPPPPLTDDRASPRKLKRARPAKRLPVFSMANSDLLSTFSDVAPPPRQVPPDVVPTKTAPSTLGFRDHWKPYVIESNTAAPAPKKPKRVVNMSIANWLT
ncbi:Aste57867_8534 [Aphanomyces stellatus]|uniref:Aste57867_8534 protein n=1 Tax=Aphanomyces stellatus TaxID=120398 RepID=A0A485KKH8_9STRA|nr:hypothetical protein As57867_008502 [Aphanomyces stellatus]VFT85420.1 Aste57867_8534 [Aphanomyces stellatus]